MKVYEIILESGNNVYKEYIPAESAKLAKEYAQGNGEIIRCKESDLYPNNSISTEKVANALRQAMFGENEINIISRALYQINITD